MEQYIIKGGNPLVGEVEIGGAKNAALAILAAAIMTDETVLIDNLPDVNDINVLLDAISGIGASGWTAIQLGSAEKEFITLTWNTIISKRSARLTICWARCWGSIRKLKWPCRGDAISEAGRLTSI